MRGLGRRFGFTAIGPRYREFVAREGITLEIRNTAGSVENIKLLEAKEGRVDIAFVQGGIGDPAAHPGLRSLGSLYFEPWVFYHRSLQIRRLPDLRGKRIAVGPEESGVNDIATKLLAANGVNAQTATLLPLGGEKVVEALREKRAEAAFLVVSPQSALIRNLFSQKDLNLLSFERGEAYQRAHRSLSILKLPEGVMDFGKNVPTLGTDAATWASGVAVSFATSSAMVERLRISVNQILGSNYTHMVGTYQVVGRLTSSAAVTSAQRFLVRTYQGLLNGTKELTGETAFNPDSTTTRLTELGYFRIPPTGYRISAGIGCPVLCASSTLYFYVQRLSGTATLTIGKIYLIPAEPIMIMKTGGLTDIADVAYFLSSPAGDTTAIVSHNSTTSYSLREHTAGPMLWPRDGGVVVLLAQKSTDSKEGFTSDLSMSVYPRYSLFRDT